MLLLAIRLPSSHRSYLYAILNLGETTKNDTRCLYIYTYMHIASLRISIDEDYKLLQSMEAPEDYIFLDPLIVHLQQLKLPA
ncbi:hypothetical protein VIGAN_08162700 [Vigna angularis var. angularis]|uniref:Uncharacterized protein n=1 Tax=Vigna angularis var. angularis TaxID=157739 RepID=A0A0S3SQ72_PHAAN|nr:hypothetical protein VIGAN_08162700 [Vigna angularis var. angularis]